MQQVKEPVEERFNSFVPLNYTARNSSFFECCLYAIYGDKQEHE